MQDANFAYISDYGIVSIEALGSITLPPPEGRTVGAAVSHECLLWLPPTWIRRAVPAGLQLKFNCYIGPDELRRFTPVGGFLRFIESAFDAGFGILTTTGKMDAAMRNSYRAMRMLFAVVRRMQEHLDREFQYSRDLFIRRPGREARSDRSVLPAWIGKTADGKGRTWSVKTLMEEGRNAARLQDIESPSPRQCISFGVTVAAVRNPLIVDFADTDALLRTALFDLPAGPLPSEKMISCVTERVLKAIHRHLDDRFEDMNRWLLGGNSNFATTIARQRKSPGGILPIEVVRRVILELGWQSYGYLADCLRAFAAWFKRALPSKLNEAESAIFDAFYFPQDHFAGLPLVLLLERRSFIQPAVVDVLNGELEAIPVLHQVLAVYGEMAGKRRAADRRSKPNSPFRYSPFPGGH